MIGSAVIGTTERVGAGPALVISIALVAIACIFPALCYAEFASMIPVLSVCQPPSLGGGWGK